MDLLLSNWLPSAFQLLLLGLGGWYLWHESRPWREQRLLRRHGRPVLATVLRIEPDHDSMAGDRLHLRFTAAPNGAAEAPVETTTYDASGTWAVGDQLPMRYDPRNPRRCLTTAELRDPGHLRGLLFLTGSVLYVLLICFPTWFGIRPGHGEWLATLYFFLFLAPSFLIR